MDKKYLDKFYDEFEREDQGNSVFALALPITMVYNSLINSSKYVLDEYDLTKSEVDVLIALYKNSNKMTPTELYRALVFTSSGIAKVLKKLEVKQLISREESKEDKRSILVVLESKGLNIATECLEKIYVHHEDFFKHLDKKEKDDLRKILKKMVYSL